MTMPKIVIRFLGSEQVKRGFPAAWPRAMVLMAAGLLLTCCSKPTKPEPTTRYLLYAGMTASAAPWEGFVAVIDCKTDSIVDSVILPSYASQPGVIASPDGKYLAILTTHPSEIFDAVTRGPVATLLKPGWPLFLSDAGLLFCEGTDSSLVYEIPGFKFKEAWPRPLRPAQPVPGRQQIAAIEHNEAPHSKLMFFDYVNYRVVDSVLIDPGGQDARFLALRFAFSPDGRHAYVIGSQEGFGPCVVGYDLPTREVLFRKSLYAPFGYCRVTPDGHELWVTDPGGPIEDAPGWPQTIFIYDATSGSLLDTVSIRGLHPNPLSALAPQDIRFVPDGSKAYINCGSPTKGKQPILVVDASTRKVVRMLFGDFRNRAVMIDIAPYP